MVTCLIPFDSVLNSESQYEADYVGVVVATRAHSFHVTSVFFLGFSYACANDDVAFVAVE